jgi:hypothetical protein
LPYDSCRPHAPATGPRAVRTNVAPRATCPCPPRRFGSRADIQRRVGTVRTGHPRVGDDSQTSGTTAHRDGNPGTTPPERPLRRMDDGPASRLGHRPPPHPNRPDAPARQRCRPTAGHRGLPNTSRRALCGRVEKSDFMIRREQAICGRSVDEDRATVGMPCTSPEVTKGLLRGSFSGCDSIPCPSTRQEEPKPSGASDRLVIEGGAAW